MIDNKKVSFILKKDAIERSIYCPVCDSSHKSTSFAKVPHPYKSELLHIYECSHCYSYIYEDIFRIGYLELPSDIEEIGTQHYCLIGCGIDFGINILSRLYENNKKKELIEIGCGFGYNLSFWESFKKQKATGLEKAKYGLIGRDELNVNILPSYLDEIRYKKKYDIVLSTEVIEHVQNPLVFLKQALLVLKKNGILVFTTPSKESVINNTNNPAVLNAIFSPGYHEFIISKKGIINLLEKLNIGNYKIELVGNHYITYLTNSKDVLAQIKPKSIPDEYSNFLRFLIENKSGIVKEGALYRYFKYLINKGLYEEARFYFLEILSLLSEKYNLNLILLYKTEPQLDDFIRNLPPYLGPFFFYAGILHSHRIEDLNDKCMFFSLAVNTLKRTIVSAPRFSQEAESLLHEAENQLAKACRDIQINRSYNNSVKFTINNLNIYFKKLIKRYLG